MAYFAEINALRKVIRVLALDDNDTFNTRYGIEDEAVGAKYLSKAFGGTWLRTSYNTSRGVHLLGGTPFRKNYGGVGFTYDPDRDAFIPPKLYPSWTLDEETCTHVPPIAYPDDGKMYDWDKETTSWVEDIT